MNNTSQHMITINTPKPSHNAPLEHVIHVPLGWGIQTA